MIPPHNIPILRNSQHCRLKFSPPRARPSKRCACVRRSIIFSGMGPLRYALVAYVKAPMAEFVEQLRSELHSGLQHLPADITGRPLLPKSRPNAAKVERPTAYACLGTEWSR